jgi:hypothetical protein
MSTQRYAQLVMRGTVQTVREVRLFIIASCSATSSNWSCSSSWLIGATRTSSFVDRCGESVARSERSKGC